MKRLNWLSLVALLVLVVGVSPVFAQTCSGSECQGQDPVATGCSADGQWLNAASFATGGIVQGHVQFMYSPTCQTVWSRISTFNQLGTPRYSAFMMFGGGLTSLRSTSAPYSASYSFTQVVDINTAFHKDSLMLHVSDTRFINQGVKAGGTLLGTSFSNILTPFFIKPDMLP